MPTPKSALIMLALVVCTGAACKKKNKRSGETEVPGVGAQGAQGGTTSGKPGLASMKVDDSRCSVDGKQKDFQDINQDGRADLITLYGGGGSGQKIDCKQADLNFDGNLDAFFHYGAGGDVDREQFDLDFDGRIDMGRYYETGVLTRDEQDLNQDGAVDTWRYYDKGRLVRLEDDRDANGKPDRFVYYVGGMIDRIGYDVNGDAKVDQWDHDAARRVRLAVQNRAAQKAAEASKAAEGEYVDVPDQEGAEGAKDGKAPEGDDAKKDAPKDAKKDAKKDAPKDAKDAKSKKGSDAEKGD